jgi:hypothetical protein
MDAWRRGYERSVAQRRAAVVAPAPAVRVGRPILSNTPYETRTTIGVDEPIMDQRPPAANGKKPWREGDFERYWQDAPWPEKQAQNKAGSRGYDRRDDYADSMYQDRVKPAYRNPYRDVRDSDADGFGDSNRFNNDSDYNSPAELRYRGKVRNYQFGHERYDEYEQRVDDSTMGHREYSKPSLVTENGWLDVTRYR